MNLYKFLNLGFVVLLFTNPIASMEIEKNFGQHFNKLSPEIREKVLSHLSLSTWSALSQTSGDWQQTIKPFSSSSSRHIDFKRYFSERTTFRFEYSKSAFWILAREYKEETGNQRQSHLYVIKIGKSNLQETVTNLNMVLGWSGRVTEGPVTCTGSANPICFSSCP